MRAALQPASTPPLTQAPGLNITDWKYTLAPQLNGHPLPLMAYEMSRSLAIAPDGHCFVLGTEWYLRCYDRQGKELWKALAPSATWGVNISGDGRIVVAAYADGTIRWHRLSDGQELLALFAHADRKRSARR